MKIPFLQHEYTWSDHCITGNKLGWGVTASSIPQSREILREVEKLAVDAEPDRMDGIPVEYMIYSPVIGFTRMCALPLDQGEDGRNNKLVKILQVTDPEARDPGVYFAETGYAFDPEPENEREKDRLTGRQLPVKKLRAMKEDPDDILRSMGLSDKLPIFLRAIFWSLLEYPGSLNIVTARWEKEQFALHAGRLMYAIHCLLPEHLRTKAGYRSYAWRECTGTAFYFSRQVYGPACFELDGIYKPESGKNPDILNDHLFERLAFYWKEHRALYYEVMQEISDYLKESEGSGMGLKKIGWIFYNYALNQGDKPLPESFILQSLPELIYWGNQEERLKKIADKLLSEIHDKGLTKEEEAIYVESLLEKVSARSLPDVCRELELILEKKDREESREAEAFLHRIKDKNEVIYRGILKDLADEEEWKEIILLMESPESSESHESSESSDGAKKEMRQTPPAFLRNAMQKRGEDGLLITEDRREDNQGNQGARGNQNNPGDYGGPGDHEVTGDHGSDEHRGKASEGSSDRYKNSKKDKKNKNNKTDAEYRKLSAEEEEYRNSAGTKEFLLTALPTGFLTGCALFLSHYSLMIGHWKIAVGMGGMWLILILNYAYILKKTQPERHLWMGVGLCFLIGELIRIGADYFVLKEYRIYYFIVLGGIAAVVQLIRVMREILKNKNKTGEKEDEN